MLGASREDGIDAWGQELGRGMGTIPGGWRRCWEDEEDEGQCPGVGGSRKDGDDAWSWEMEREEGSAWS